MHKHLQKLLLIVALLLPWATNAQSLSEYTLTVDTTTFNSIVSTGTAMSFSTQDDGYAAVTLPFAFPFGESSLASGSTIACSANGFLYLGSSSTSGVSASYSSTSYRIINAILQQDGHIGRYAGSSGAFYQYDATEGTLTIEYHQLGTFSSPYGQYSYQVVLHTNGTIELIYDTMDNGGSTRTLATYLSDGPNGDRVFLSGAWASPTVSSSYTTRPNSPVPAHGLRYTFSRPIISCPRPISLSVSNLAPDSFDATWVDTTDATSWIVRLDTAGVSVFETSSSINSYSFSSLMSNTPYTVSVAGICSNGDTSTWRSMELRTPCGFITSLPYLNSFEEDPYYSSVPYADAVPYCWTRINDASGSYNYYPYITTTTNYVHSGSKGMYWYMSTSDSYANNQYAVLPGIDTTVLCQDYINQLSSHPGCGCDDQSR